MIGMLAEHTEETANILASHAKQYEGTNVVLKELQKEAGNQADTVARRYANVLFFLLHC